jgi:uncharacterized protein YodC (DUF2158 family)
MTTVEFCVGDTVRLKSGGPEMRVHSIRNDVARCTWIHRDIGQFAYFQFRLLVLVAEPP